MREGQVGTRRPAPLAPNLMRVKQAVERDRQTKLTALLHHLDVASLERAFRGLRRAARPGTDGITVADYEKELTANLTELCDRVQSQRYRPCPARRTYIPKRDGGSRPLAILILEDKIVQSAMAELLAVIYEVEFADFSYGFRPGRRCHQALAEVQRNLMRQRLNFVLDADISKFFDSVDHEKMLQVLAHRIADRRVLTLITRWLKAGVLESGVLWQAEEGTPQGAPISPLLANVFLHYALDNWFVRWQQEHPGLGPMMMVRYADDFVMGFGSQEAGEATLSALTARLARCGLKLHETKTRLIEFGRFAAERRQRRGAGRPETFAFLGFTHYCGTTRGGKFVVKRKAVSKRVQAKLVEVKAGARERMHEPLQEQHRWLAAVLRGFFQYYGIADNTHVLASFYDKVKAIWRRALMRRSRERRFSWRRLNSMLTAYPLPLPRIHHPVRPWAAASR